VSGARIGKTGKVRWSGSVEVIVRIHSRMSDRFSKLGKNAQVSVTLFRGRERKRLDSLPFFQDQRMHLHLRDCSVTDLLEHLDFVEPMRSRSQRVLLHRNRVVVGDEAERQAVVEEQESKREYLVIARSKKLANCR